MLKALNSALLNAALSLFGMGRIEGHYVGRAYVRDAAAFPFRMGATVPGTVNRTHPFTIEGCLADAGTPPTAFGQPVVVDTGGGVRPLVAGDSGLTAIYGITVRPYPFQQQATTNYGSTAFGDGAPATDQAVDVLRSGYITGRLGGTAVAAKGGAVFVWVAADSGAHKQGYFEAEATGGSTIALDAKTTFNGPADANGFAEVAFNI